MTKLTREMIFEALKEKFKDTLIHISLESPTADVFSGVILGASQALDRLFADLKSAELDLKTARNDLLRQVSLNTEQKMEISALFAALNNPPATPLRTRTEDYCTKDCAEADADPHMVFVEGKSTPRKIHYSLGAAEAEAQRLASSEVPNKVHVLKHVKSFKGEVRVQEVA